MENIKVIKNTTGAKKDIVRAGVATTTFKDIVGEPFKMIGIVKYEKVEEGETVTVIAVKKDDEEFVSSISPTVNNSLELILEAYDADELAQGIDVIVKSKKSNGGRDFLYVDLV